MSPQIGEVVIPQIVDLTKRSKLPWLRDKKGLANNGEHLTLSSVVEEIDGEGTVIKYVVGFGECCRECREGFGHHEFGPADWDEYFLVIGKARRPRDIGKYVNAGTILTILEELCLLWNPEKEPGMSKAHFNEFSYEIVDQKSTTPRLKITEISYGAWIDRSYHGHEPVEWRKVATLMEYATTLEEGMAWWHKAVSRTNELMETIVGNIMEETYGVDTAGKPSKDDQIPQKAGEVAL